MTTLRDSLTAATGRPVRMRVRADLIFRRQVYQGSEFWIVKDPVGLQYHRLQTQEYHLLQMIDGKTSLGEIKARIEERFPPKKLRLEDLHRWLATLNQMGLLIADATDQGAQLLKRAAKKRRAKILGVLSNLLAIRIRGVDPDRFLAWLYPKVRWFFSPWAVAIAVGMMLAAAGSVLVNLATFQAKLPEFHQFFGPSNWFVLAVALGLTKVCHELGHGLTCKHHGGECHELGLMLLVMTPCLYCNVSDSWLLPSRWRRAAIGAGGMYVELVIASLATFGWWLSEPGLLNQLCLNIMFVCSVSTLIFNGNPLLRYDGYYILADLLEIPNMRQKASTILQRKMSEWCLGVEPPPDPFLPQRHQVLFAIYAVASFIYGWVVVLGIIWFLNKVLEPYGLKIIGQFFALLAAAGIFIQPAWKVWKFIVVPGRLENVKARNVRWSLVALVAVVGIIAFLPLPHRVWCAAEIKLRNAESVYVSAPGRMVELLVRPGEQVRKGQPMARLENLDLAKAVQTLRGKQAIYEARLEGLNFLRSRDRQSGEEIAAVKESLASVTEQLQKKESELRRLTLTAPLAGTIFAAPQVPDSREGDDRLPTWSGTPFDARNQQAWLSEGSVFCQIGDPAAWEADLVVDQTDIDFVAVDQDVALKLDQFPGTTLSGTIARLAKLDIKVAPRTLSQRTGGEVITKTDAAGHERLQSTSFQASVPLDESEAMLRPGLRGQANVYVRWESLGSRFVRYLARTFHFQW